MVATRAAAHGWRRAPRPARSAVLSIYGQERERRHRQNDNNETTTRRGPVGSVFVILFSGPPCCFRRHKEGCGNTTERGPAGSVLLTQFTFGSVFESHASVFHEIGAVGKLSSPAFQRHKNNQKRAYIKENMEISRLRL